MKYIPADKLIAEIERRKAILDTESPFGIGGRVELELVINTITSLQQEQPDGIEGVVHHFQGVHYIVTNQEQLTARLRQFPSEAEVKIFIFARKEE